MKVLQDLPEKKIALLQDLQEGFMEGRARRLGYFNVGLYQTSVYYTLDSNSVMVVYSRLSENLKDAVITDVVAIPCYSEPIDLTKDVSEKIEFLKELALDIVTRKYPLPAQVAYWMRLQENPNSSETQAMLDACENSMCLCPLFFSIGCLHQTLELPINSLVGRSYEPRDPMNKRPFRLLVAALRQHLPASQVRALIEEAKEEAELETFLLESYSKRREE